MQHMHIIIASEKALSLLNAPVVLDYLSKTKLTSLSVSWAS
jgi:hypothetical protein